MFGALNQGQCPRHHLTQPREPHLLHVPRNNGEKRTHPSGPICTATLRSLPISVAHQVQVPPTWRTTTDPTPPPHEICACKSGHVIPPLKPSHSFPTPLTERNALQDRRPGATRPARPSSSSCPSLPLSQNTGRLPSPVPQPGGVSGSGLAVSLTSFPALLPRYLLREASPISEATFQSHVLHNAPSEHLALPDTTLHNYGFTTVLTNSIWGEALKKRQCSRPHPKQ